MKSGHKICDILKSCRNIEQFDAYRRTLYQTFSQVTLFFSSLQNIIKHLSDFYRSLLKDRENINAGKNWAWKPLKSLRRFFQHEETWIDLLKKDLNHQNFENVLKKYKYFPKKLGPLFRKKIAFFAWGLSFLFFQNQAGFLFIFTEYGIFWGIIFIKWIKTVPKFLNCLRSTFSSV